MKLLMIKEKNIIGAIVVLGTIIGILLLIYLKGRDYYLIQKYGRYTIAKTIRTGFVTQKHGRQVFYEFEVDHQHFTDFSNYYQTIKVPNGNYLIKFYPGNPQIHYIYFKKELSDSKLILSPNGWSALPKEIDTY